jgi:hypothetical protein
VRARANAEHLGPHRHTAGWAIPGWFVPFANLAVPGRVVADVWRASPTPRQQYVSTALVTAWWLTATGTWLLYVVGMALRIDTSAPPASSVGGRAAGVEPARATHDRTQRSGALVRTVARSVEHGLRQQLPRRWSALVAAASVFRSCRRSLALF